ncbi:hypothetical protein B0I35DRAFT_350840 [Stachybotrys elegans]|uniref:Uncharacterized protein n=1 Tax=Stachybotrys elegans TaxID=80388 RepID=A0A8K0WUD9_9HYPO|nr:hypothetical protein B0I35DRAFT_350840 [Stachybotrys elegans]
MDIAEPRQLSIDSLDGPHRDILERAISRVLATDVAEHTFAQIIDGLPTSRVAKEEASGLPHGHPLRYTHTELCAGIREKTQDLWNQFSMSDINLDAQLLFAYRAASPGSRAFNTRLIELAAVAIHKLAVKLFQRDDSLHKEDGIADWAPPRTDELYWRWNPDGPLPTLFVHEWYRDCEQYPDGIADVVGYWAESRIFGGVVLFDRHESKDGTSSDDIYIHPSRESLTYRICQLLPGQKQALLAFLAKPESQPNPLPILVDMNNGKRIDPEEPIEETRVYRDIWERKYDPDSHGEGRLRTVWDRKDYPTWDDKMDALCRAKARQRGG